MLRTLFESLAREAEGRLALFPGERSATRRLAKVGAAALSINHVVTIVGIGGRWRLLGLGDAAGDQLRLGAAPVIEQMEGAVAELSPLIE